MTTTMDLFHLAWQHHQQGRLAEAVSEDQQSLSIKPDIAEHKIIWAPY